MRYHMVVLALPLLALAACGGAGPEALGSIAPPAPTAGTGAGNTGGSGGTGTGVGSGAVGATTPATASFLNVAAETQFAAVGAMSSFSVSEDGATLYAGNASTVRTPSGTISYSPRDGIFTINFADTKAIVTRQERFQDPAHRSDITPATTQERQVPALTGFNFLGSATQVDTKTIRTTFFYQRPNATTYVTLAGFTHTEKDSANPTYLSQRGAFVFGAQTSQQEVPRAGKGSYTGGFLAAATLGSDAQPVLQWINGQSKVDVDFGASTVALAFTGTTNAAYRNNTLLTDQQSTYPIGTAFTANATATIDLVRSGGFTGSFADATLGGTAIDFRGITPGSNVAGASSVDGTFFGPNAVNVGGNFRIIGGVPGQRIDIQGAFTGATR